MESEMKADDKEQPKRLSLPGEKMEVRESVNNAGKTSPSVQESHQSNVDGSSKNLADENKQKGENDRSPSPKPENPEGQQERRISKGERNSLGEEKKGSKTEDEMIRLEKKATPEGGISSEDDSGDTEFYMESTQVKHIGITRVPDKLRIVKSSAASIFRPEPPPDLTHKESVKKIGLSPRHAALREKYCKARKAKCMKKATPNDLDEADPSMLWNDDGKPIPVVRGIPAPYEECNPYCRWLKRQLILDGSGDKLDSIMTLRELGEKYVGILGETKCVLVNLTGTLLVDNAPTPNAIQAVEMLRDFGLTIKFITNTTQFSRRLLIRRLIMLGFRVEADDFFTSVFAARKYIEDEKLRPYFLVEEAAMEDFSGIKTNNPNAVVVGLAPTNFDYLRFNKALRLVMAGAPIIGIHKARMHKLANGLLSLGPGPFIDVLQYASSAPSVIVGKPSESFFRAAMASAGCCADGTVIIGDDIEADIEGAQKCGMKGILVKTGKYKENDETKIADLNPTLVAKNFAIAVRCIVGAVAVQNGMKTGESDTEDPKKTARDRVLKGELSSDVEFIEKIRAYVNDCGRPVWCQEAEKEHPPRLKPSEYYTEGTGVIKSSKKKSKANLRGDNITKMLLN